MDAAAKERVVSAIKEQLDKVKDQHVREILEDEAVCVAEGTDISFIDKDISVVYPKPQTLLDYIGNEYLVMVQESSMVNSRLQSYEFHRKEEIEALLKEKLVSGKYADYGNDSTEFGIFL